MTKPANKPSTAQNLRAGIAYMLLALATRIHPGLIGEIVGMTFDAAAKYARKDVA